MGDSRWQRVRRPQSTSWVQAKKDLLSCAGALSGCGAHRALVANIPHDGDREHMADIPGDNSCEPKRMRRFFERIEHCHYLPEDTPGHGFHVR